MFFSLPSEYTPPTFLPPAPTTEQILGFSEAGHIHYSFGFAQSRKGRRTRTPIDVLPVGPVITSEKVLRE
jgi:hypothetical protein